MLKKVLHWIKIILSWTCVVIFFLAIWNFTWLKVKLIISFAFINFLISEYLDTDDSN